MRKWLIVALCLLLFPVAALAQTGFPSIYTPNTVPGFVGWDGILRGKQDYAPIPAQTLWGNNTGGSAFPGPLTAAQVAAMISSYITGTLAVTDGTTTLTGVNHIQFSGATVSGTAPNAVVTIPGGGGGTPGGTNGAIQYNASGAFAGAVLSGLIKGNGTSPPTAAVAGTDYLPASAPNRNVASGGVTITSSDFGGQVNSTDAAAQNVTTPTSIGAGQTFTFVNLGAGLDPIVNGGVALNGLGFTSVAQYGWFSCTGNAGGSADCIGNVGGSGSGSVNSGTSGQLGYYAGTGTAISGTNAGTGVLTALGNATNAANGFCVISSSNACNYRSASIGWIAGVNPNNAGVIVLPANSTLVSIVGNVETATGSAATVTVNVAASGTACSAGTAVHSGSFNANGTAATNQTLTLTTTAITSGQRLCLQTTGTTAWTGGSGVGTLTVAYTTP